MNKNEKALFFELCKHKNPNENILKELTLASAATPELLGYLCHNRMAGMAYHVLNQTNLLSCVNREFRNHLKAIYTYSLHYNNDYLNSINEINEILLPMKSRYAMLKGAYLCFSYPKGCRTSNDIDLLIRASDISQAAELLCDAGYKRGHVRNGKFTEATRSEIIESKMTRGEVVPFIRDTGNDFMRYSEVDLNFSLDYKNASDDSVVPWLCSVCIRESGVTEIPTLDRYFFLLHLCAHLYKEATTYPWVRMGRDMNMYKYTDIAICLDDFTEDDDAEFARVCKMNKAELYVSYALGQTAAIIPYCSEHIDRIKKYIGQTDAEPDRVISPSDKKIYEYTERDPAKRLLCRDRTKLLKEVT